VDKIQIANEGINGCNTRSLFIFGSMKAYEKAKIMIQEIVDKHK
jgi:hypothetical protein